MNWHTYFFNRKQRILYGYCKVSCSFAKISQELVQILLSKAIVHALNFNFLLTSFLWHYIMLAEWSWHLLWYFVTLVTEFNWTFVRHGYSDVYKASFICHFTVSYFTINTLEIYCALARLTILTLNEGKEIKYVSIERTWLNLFHLTT